MGLWALPLLPTPPLFSGDGWSYVADGLLTGHHLSPYVVPPSALTGPILEAVSSRWLHAVAPYGPLPMLWGGAAAHLSGNLWLILYAYRALAVVGLGSADVRRAAARRRWSGGTRPRRRGWPSGVRWSSRTVWPDCISTC